MLKTNRRLLISLTSAIIAALILVACSTSNTNLGTESGTNSRDVSKQADSKDPHADPALDEKVAARNGSYDKAPTMKLSADQEYVVAVETTEGDFQINLDRKAGPIAAANFAFLVKEGFYDGVKFHRIIKDFMVQTGDPTGTGSGGPGYAIKDDKVTKSYERGTVAMANSGKNTGGSQFFIMHGDSVHLGPDYSIFGSVDEEGMKTIDKIANTPVKAAFAGGEESTPTRTVRITKATLIEGGA